MRIVNYDISNAAQAEIDWASRYDDYIEQLITEADNEEDGELYNAVVSKFGKPEPSLCDLMNEREDVYEFVNQTAYDIAEKRSKEF